MLTFTDQWTGYVALAVFLAAYVLVIVEETLHLRKSKPVMVAAGAIWILTAIAYVSHNQSHAAAEILRHNLLEYAELLLFLLSAMTFINTMSERNIFEALRARLVSRGLSLRAVFWLTGMLAFFISPVADNLTTALVMGAVVMAMGAGNGRFIAAACINVVVAANAGGTFSPFGDITTLMVWQKGVVQFGDFFALFVPSLINWLVPAALISMTISGEKPSATTETVQVKIWRLCHCDPVSPHHSRNRAHASCSCDTPVSRHDDRAGRPEILWLFSPAQGAGRVDGNSRI